VTAAAVGAAGSLALQLSRANKPPVTAAPAIADATPTAVATLPVATPAVVATPVPVASTPVAIAVQPSPEVDLARGLPDGTVLVASPRLPLSAVGPEDVWRLLKGDISDWAAIGSPIHVPVRTFALADVSTRGGAATTLADYEALTEALRNDAGAVALVPADVVDFRVQALSVGGVDPLTSPVGDQSAIRIGVVGDIVPGRNVHLHMQQYGDFTRPFLRVAPLLRSFDLTVANLEGNLSDTLPQPEDPHSVTFVSSPAMLEGFSLAGIDAVTLANNHTVWNSENWGVQGLLDTIAALDAHGLPYFGAGTDIARARQPWVVEVGNTSIAFLGIDGVTANHEVAPSPEAGVLDFDAAAGDDYPGTNPYLLSQLSADVASATELADVVIPYFHLGAEYVAVVPPWAVAAARAAIDAGAAMVVTNHPHVNQGMEIYAGKPIIYSPGNFILDQMWAAEVRSGYVLEIVLRNNAVIGLRFHGVEIEDFHQPRPMSAGEQAALMDRFWAATDRLAARVATPA
jgi:poly-gamma-glutamate synthesis protein (capsule biosynthesis protein)